MTEITHQAELVGNTVPVDMSLLGLFTGADIVVKLVILLLVAGSIYSWTIIFDKMMRFKAIKSKTDKFEKVFWSGQMLDQLYQRVKGRSDHPIAIVFCSAMQELSKQNISKMTDSNQYKIQSIKQRISQAMNVSVNREIEKMHSGVGMLATISSSAPFVGLFGTVWGIMDSFQSIAISKNTTLAVVAPGIAEALFATAIGLAVAIPAGIFYNIISNQINYLSAKLDDFSSELDALLSREIDEGL